MTSRHPHTANPVAARSGKANGKDVDARARNAFGQSSPEEPYLPLAERILLTLGRGRGSVLLTGDPAPSLLLTCQALRKAGAGRYTVVGVASGPEVVRAHLLNASPPPVITSVPSPLPESSVAEATSPTPTERPPLLFVLDQIDRLGDEQLSEICEMTLRGKRTVAGAVLLASPAFLDRLQRPALEALRSDITDRFTLEPPGEPASELAASDHLNEFDAIARLLDDVIDESTPPRRPQREPLDRFALREMLAELSYALERADRALDPPDTEAENSAPLTVEAPLEPQAFAPPTRLAPAETSFEPPPVEPIAIEASAEAPAPVPLTSAPAEPIASSFVLPPIEDAAALPEPKPEVVAPPTVDELSLHIAIKLPEPLQDVPVAVLQHDLPPGSIDVAEPEPEIAAAPTVDELSPPVVIELSEPLQDEPVAVSQHDLPPGSIDAPEPEPAPAIEPASQADGEPTLPTLIVADEPPPPTFAEPEPVAVIEPPMMEEPAVPPASEPALAAPVELLVQNEPPPPKEPEPRPVPSPAVVPLTITPLAASADPTPAAMAPPRPGLRHRWLAASIVVLLVGGAGVAGAVWLRAHPIKVASAPSAVVALVPAPTVPTSPSAPEAQSSNLRKTEVDIPIAPPMAKPAEAPAPMPAPVAAPPAPVAEAPAPITVVPTVPPPTAESVAPTPTTPPPVVAAAPIPAPSPPVAAPVAKPAETAKPPLIAAPPRRIARAPSLPPEEIAALIARGDGFLGNGDIVSARLFYERAAEAGNGQAALLVGETYDPKVLARAGLRAIRGDAHTAALWYQRAVAMGVADAETLLKNLEPR